MRVVLALLLASGTALADTRVVGEQLRFFSPLLPWTLALPKEDWTVLEEKAARDRSNYYYVVQSNSRGVQMVVQIDRNAYCKSAPSCRESFLNTPSPGMRNPQDLRTYDRNGFAVAQFLVVGVGGVPIPQANVSAHRYEDGHWVHVRLQKVGEKDPANLIGVLDGITVK